LDIDWLVGLAERHPEISDALIRDRRVTRRTVSWLAELWELGIGAAWTVNTPERAGLLFTTRNARNARWALGGVPDADVQILASQMLRRSTRLVADWVRRNFDGQPFIANPVRGRAVHRVGRRNRTALEQRLTPLRLRAAAFWTTPPG